MRTTLVHTQDTRYLLHLLLIDVRIKLWLLEWSFVKGWRREMHSNMDHHVSMFIVGELKFAIVISDLRFENVRQDTICTKIQFYQNIT